MIESCKDLVENHPDCVHCSRASKILAEENKKKYILNNPDGKKICRARVDGCLIPSQGQKKCDFMIMVCETKDIYLIELKGRKLLDAAKQISQTIEHFREPFPGKIFARIVLSQVANPRVVKVAPEITKLRKVLRRYGGELEFSSRVYDADKA